MPCYHPRSSNERIDGYLQLVRVGVDRLVCHDELGCIVKENLLIEEDLGAMMTEIGIAQRRLLDDEASSASLQFSSTATLYSTESAPFPTIQNPHAYQICQAEGVSEVYVGAPSGICADANKSSLPTRRDIYDLTPTETTRSIISPPTTVPQQAVEPMTEHENPHSNVTHEAPQPEPQHTGPYSPHDTEPLSSVASRQSNGTRIENGKASLISPQHSQSSTHDELALPVALPAVDVSVAKKKRGRPKKQSLPDIEEDDELANSRDHEFNHSGVNGAIDTSDSEQTNENKVRASSEVSSETNKDNLVSAPKPTKSNIKTSKKKNSKKPKTTPAPGPDDDDDVIWLDTKPLDVQPSDENTLPHTEPPKTQISHPDSMTTSNQPDTSNSPLPTIEEKPQPTEKAAPKKRGRKRKQPAEQAETPSEAANTPVPEAATPAPKLAVIVDNSPRNISEANTSVDNVTSDIQTKERTPQPASDANPSPATTYDTPNPQTPSKPDAGSINTPRNASKGPDKHSPISARSAVPYRVGLSKRARIAPLLKMVRK